MPWQLGQMDFGGNMIARAGEVAGRNIMAGFQSMGQGIQSGAAAVADGMEKAAVTQEQLDQLDQTARLYAEKGQMTAEKLEKFMSGSKGQKTAIIQDLMARDSLNQKMQLAAAHRSADFNFDPKRDVVAVPGIGTVIRTSKGGVQVIQGTNSGGDGAPAVTGAVDENGNPIGNIVRVPKGSKFVPAKNNIDPVTLQVQGIDQQIAEHQAEMAKGDLRTGFLSLSSREQEVKDLQQKKAALLASRPGKAPTPTVQASAPATQTINPQDQQALEWANANPADPRAIKIKARLGVK